MRSNLSIHRLQFVILIGIILAGTFFFYLDRTNQTITNFSFMPLFMADYNIIRIGEIAFVVEIANTPEARERGLSGRKDLGEKQGMLFVFREAGYHGLWMKDMKFAIDVIWISEDFKVVDITRNLSPDTYPRIFEPRKPAKYALETEVLFIDTFSISIGQEVSIPKAMQTSR